MTTDQPPVPLVDLKAAHAEVEAEVRAGFDRVLATGGYIRGPEADGFEAEYAAFSGTRHCVGAANGTDAVELALRALDLPPAAAWCCPPTPSSPPPRPWSGPGCARSWSTPTPSTC